jgi:hypothetical protein
MPKGDGGDGRRVLSNRDKTLVFELSPAGAGICLTRIEQLPGTGSTSHSVQLDSVAAYESFQAADPARFQHPQLFAQVMREVAHFFDNGAGRAPK